TNYFQSGALFENINVNEIVKYYYNRGERPPLYYWQEHNKYEIDLLIDKGDHLIPVEIKSSATFHPHFFKNITWFHGISKMPVEKSYVIYGGDRIGKWNLALCSVGRTSYQFSNRIK
ncbi:MAG: DUF4143 domain-containing protein, partial [Melioribacteraceae bacterium]|nr:DUF4143 domain-containing protein [Melioribacteraceae bacterium]